MTEEELANLFQFPVRVYIQFVNADTDGQLLDSGNSAARRFVKTSPELCSPARAATSSSSRSN